MQNHQKMYRFTKEPMISDNKLYFELLCIAPPDRMISHIGTGPDGLAGFESTTGTYGEKSKRRKGIIMKSSSLFKALALCLVLLMSVTALAACGGGTDSSGAAPASTGGSSVAPEGEPAADTDGGEDGDIVVWGWSIGEVQTLFDAFKAETGYTGNMEYVTIQQTEAFQKLQTTISAGLDMPDVISSEIRQRGTMMSLDIWEDMSAAPYNFDPSTIFEYFGPLCTDENGAFVCMPMDVSTAGLAYKKELAEKYLGTSDRAELEAMLPDWEAFQAVGEKLQQDTNGEVFMLPSLNNVQQMLDGQNPTPIISGNKLDLSSVENTLTAMVAFRDNKVADNISESSPAYNASFVDETHIFYPCAAWGPAYVIGPNDPEGADRWAMMVPPEGCFSWGGSGNMIPKDAKNKEGAFKFVSWLTSLEGTTEARELTGNNYANKEAYDDPAFAKMTDPSFGEQNLGEILFVEAMPTINVRPVSLHDVTITETWSYVVESVNSDASLDVAGALELFETEIRNKIPDLE